MSRSTKAPAGLALALALGSLAGGGCSGFSHNRIDDCRLRVQSLQSENEQLRDVVSNVRNQNRDMAMRSLDDARRVRTQEEAINRLERSISAYQEERNRMAALLEDIQGQVRSASSALPPTALLQRLHELERTYPGLEVDDASATMSFPASPIFLPGETRLTADAEAWLGSVGSIVRSYVAEHPGEAYQLFAELPDTGAIVRVAATATAGEPNEMALFDGQPEHLRAELARTTGIDAANIRVTTPIAPEAADEVVAAASSPRDRATIRLLRVR
jgi:hypothetical protein